MYLRDVVAQIANVSENKHAQIRLLLHICVLCVGIGCFFTSSAHPSAKGALLLLWHIGSRQNLTPAGLGIILGDIVSFFICARDSYTYTYV
jgi:hypothetical protein